MKLSNRIFSILFGLIALGEFISFLDGKNWCFFAAILTGWISLVFYMQSKPKKTNEYSRN